MKNPKVLVLSMLLSAAGSPLFADVSAEVSSIGSVVKQEAHALSQAVKQGASEGAQVVQGALESAPAQDAKGVLDKIIAFPGYLVGGAATLVGAVANGILLSGSTVVEMTGNGLMKVGDVGSSIVVASQEHRTASGIIGLVIVYMALTKTEAGRSVAQRIKGAVSALFTSDDNQEDTRFYADHRAIAMYLK